MASSQTYYSNEEAHQTTLKILMETAADVYFIFEGNNNNTDDVNFDELKALWEASDGDNANNVDGANHGDDGDLKMDSQETAVQPNDAKNASNIDNSNDGEMKMDSQEAVDQPNNADNANNLDGVNNGDNDETKMDSQETVDQPNDADIVAKDDGNDGEMKMDSQNTIDLNVFSQNETVKIPANKQVLAALSPVFNAEFNGPLKEQGDIKMVGTTPSTFRTFLQFFYEHKIQLTMDSVEDVMQLIDRYDVTTAWPICVEYLKKKLTVDDILWGLSMATKYRLDELKAFCMNKIQSNCAKVVGMIEWKENGKPTLRSNPNNRPLCDADLAGILPLVFTATSHHLSNPSEVTDFEMDNDIIPFTLTTGELVQQNPLRETHYCTFSSNVRMWLTHLEFSSLHDEDFDPIECNVSMWIQEKDQTNNAEPITLFTHAFRLTTDDENRVNLPNSIEIKPGNFTYRVYARISPYNPPVYAKQTIGSNRHIELAPNTIISFINSFERGVLAKALYFRAQQPQ